jgi:hypothetical protein
VKGVSLAEPNRDFDRLESDLRFLKRFEKAQASIRAGRGVKLEDVE